ncbi:MAG: beta-glucosidase [Proteobacteria bacterium]|nr:beta-glucosidase [Pseudomonadota bacterium]
MSQQEFRSSAKRTLPKGFKWGVSTAAYQIEGAAREDGRGPSVWDGFSHIPGRIANSDNGDVACDHYHRYAEDIHIMQALGVDAYRFSVAWPRVLPTGRGAANDAGLAFYDRLIDGLLEKGIEPWLCLYHWDLPQALQDQGGWPNRDIVGWFADYADLIARRFGDRVKHFATFNEPSVFTLFGYAFGWHPPATDVRSDHFKAIHHVNLAHGAAVDVLRGHNKGFQIGTVHNVQPARPTGTTAEDAAAAALLDEYWNKAFPDPQILGAYPPTLAKLIEPYIRDGDLERIKRPVDYFGMNHYSPVYARAAPGSELGFAWADSPAEGEHTPIGWPIDPGAFRDTLIDVHGRYGLPIYVTENGAGAVEKPDAPGRLVDSHRIDYLARYTDAMREAVAAGADIRGYFVWSLLDNFEWGSGYAFRFGIVYVDYATQQRILKASAHWYAGLIKADKANL